MGTKEKLISRFSKLPKDFTYEETIKLLSVFGYNEHNKGTTSGSRVRFKHRIWIIWNIKVIKGLWSIVRRTTVFFGKVLGMNKDLIVYEGNTVDEFRKDFEAGVESYIAGCKADGVEPRKPYSGTLNIRISPEAHSRIAALAKEAGTTINGYIRQALENQLKLAH